MAFQLTNLDFTGNQALNLVLHNLAAAPPVPRNGQVWFDTVLQRILLKTQDGIIDLTARQHHTGEQLAATISDFDEQVQKTKLNELALPDGEVDLGSQKIVGLATPTAPNDAVNKAYADALSSSFSSMRLDQLAAPTSALDFNHQRLTNLGAPTDAEDAVRLRDLQDVQSGMRWKDPARVATTANISLSGLPTIDGVAISEGDRVLVKNQDTASQNGIYIATSGAWTRAPDAGAGQMTAGTTLMINEGALQEDTQWRLQTDDPITVGTTPLAFTQIGAATSYLQGYGIIISGKVIAVNPSIAVVKATATFGDGAALQYAIAHNLNTLDVTVSVYYTATGDEVFCDIVRSDVNTIILGFGTAPAVDALRAVIHG